MPFRFHDGNIAQQEERSKGKETGGKEKTGDEESFLKCKKESPWFQTGAFQYI